MVYKSYWQGASATDAPDVATLSEAESRHLVKVFRARVGDAVILFNAAGTVWRGQLLRTDGRVAQVRLLEHETIAAPRPLITLGQAMPKGKTMDSVIAAMVELGVAFIAPLATDHSEVRLEKDPARAESKREHWQQTAIEAAKQSSNFYGTRIQPIASFKAFLDSLPPLPPVPSLVGGAGQQASSHGVEQAAQVAVEGAAQTIPQGNGNAASAVVSACGDLRIIGSLEEGSVPLAQLAGEIVAASRVTCLIGPEGDFSPAEYALARVHGFRPVRLSTHVLRVKTAATYIVSTVDALARAGRCD